MAMACGQEVWACALLCRRWWLRFGMRTRLRLRLCGVVVCLDVPWPGLALACSAQICVARQGCLLHTMQTGRGTVEYGTTLDMCMSPPVSQSTVLLSAEQARDTAATARTSGRLKGAGTWGAGA